MARKTKKAAKKSRRSVKKKKVARKAVKKAAKRKTAPARRKAPARKAKKAAKAAARKAPVRKKAVKKTARRSPPKKQQIGEGDYQASRNFLKDQGDFVKKHQSEIPAMGKAAEAALDGPEGDSLRAAEATAEARSRDTF